MGCRALCRWLLSCGFQQVSRGFEAIPRSAALGVTGTACRLVQGIRGVRGGVHSAVPPHIQWLRSKVAEVAGGCPSDGDEIQTVSVDQDLEDDDMSLAASEELPPKCVAIRFGGYYLGSDILMGTCATALAQYPVQQGFAPRLWIISF